MGLPIRQLNIFFSCLLLQACSSNQQAYRLAVPDSPQTLEHSRYLAGSGRATEGIASYLAHARQTGVHDFTTLRMLAKQLIWESGIHGRPGTQIMALYGASISQDQDLFPILESAIHSKFPEVQLVTLNLIEQSSGGDVDKLLVFAMSSPNWMIRLQAAYLLAKRQSTNAFYQIDALYQKVPEQLQMFFAELYACEGSQASLRRLRQLLHHNDPLVRVQSILSIARYKRDELLEEIHQLNKQIHNAQKEACLFAFSQLNDHFAIEELQKARQASFSSISLSALNSLYQLGDETTIPEITRIAETGDLYAINILAQIPESADSLYALTKHQDHSVRLNATIALLQQRDERCLPNFLEFFIEKDSDSTLVREQSPGGALYYWNIQRYPTNPMKMEVSDRLLEAFLLKSFEISDTFSLKLSQKLLQNPKNHLTRLAVYYLENHRSPETLELLESSRQMLGRPLVRISCNLALYRITGEQAYAGDIELWMKQQLLSSKLRMRPQLPWMSSELESTVYELSPEDTTALFMESVQALAQRQDQNGIETLLEIILESPPEARPLIASLVIQATI